MDHILNHVLNRTLAHDRKGRFNQPFSKNSEFWNFRFETLVTFCDPFSLMKVISSTLHFRLNNPNDEFLRESVTDFGNPSKFEKFRFLKNHEESSILLIGHVTELWQVIIIEIAVYLSSGKNNHFYLSMDIFPTFINSDFHTYANIFAMKHIAANTL